MDAYPSCTVVHLLVILIRFKEDTNHLLLLISQAAWPLWIKLYLNGQDIQPSVPTLHNPCLTPAPLPGDLANMDKLDPESKAKLPYLMELRDALYSQEFRDFVSEVGGCVRRGGM